MKPGQTRWTRLAGDLHDKQAIERRTARDRQNRPGRGQLLEELRKRPMSAKDLAVELGRPTSPRSVGKIRAVLEAMERDGLVQRTKPVETGAWIWEVCSDA